LRTHEESERRHAEQDSAQLNRIGITT